MKQIKWSFVKNEELKKSRSVSFEDILTRGKLVDITKNKNRSNQEMLVYEYENYIWVIPFVQEREDIIFLKTLYPSRKYKKIYMGGDDDEKKY
jgi:hypothetical protein